MSFPGYAQVGAEEDRSQNAHIIVQKNIVQEGKMLVQRESAPQQNTFSRGGRTFPEEAHGGAEDDGCSWNVSHFQKSWFPGYFEQEQFKKH